MPRAHRRARAPPSRPAPRSSATSCGRLRRTCSTARPARASPGLPGSAEGGVMLELGKSGSLGYPRGQLPVVRDGSVVAVLRAANWREAATAVVGERAWVFAKRKGELTGRWADEPEDA